MRERQPNYRQSSTDGGSNEGCDENLAGVVAMLERGIDAVLDDEGFAAYLRAMARFHGYSFGNVALIVAQKPDATLVAGFHRWRALGRHVRKGEQGLRILAPRRRRVAPEGENEDPSDVRYALAGFGVATVFDVSQTGGEPLPEPPAIERDLGATTAGRAVDLRLAGYLIDAGIRLEKRPTHPAAGVYLSAQRLIAVDEGLAGDRLAKTLAHEAAHHLADHRGNVPRADAETVAESAAFVVMHRFGVDTGAYSFPYVATWAEDRAVLKRNLHEIQQVSSALVTAIDGHAPHPEDALDGP